jgi:hypothetical protein
MGFHVVFGQSRNHGERKLPEGLPPSKLLDLFPRSIVISSHHFFSIKKTSDGNLKLKCRTVPHGSRDREKAGLRTDSATAQFAVIRLLLSLAVLLKSRLSSIDISCSYLQAGPYNTRNLRPPTYGLDVAKRILENSMSCICTC